MERCPECGKAHRKYPRDCAYWATVSHIIHGEEICPGKSCPRNRMRDYLARSGLTNE